MAPNPNLNLFSLINEKNMERALFKDCRVKRLKAEVEKRKGFKVAAYSASLILEENLSVDAAATVICNHIVENENHGKRKEKLNKETNRERSRSRSSSKTRKYPDRNEATKPTKGSHKVETVSFCFIFALPIWTYFNQTELRAFTSDFSCGGFNVRLLIGRPKLMSSMNNYLFFLFVYGR
ncbi:unnamed protein product [Bemisia tabaci]|nr:unnamed protein product [Bemisia tabaci]